MIRLVTTILALSACSSNDGVISSVNFVQEPIDPACAVGQVKALDDMVLLGLKESHRRTRAVFDVAGREELLLNVLTPKNRGHAVYVSIRPSQPDNPLRYRASRLAVQQADEAIYANCTEDGRTYGPASVTIEGQKE
jgi:hypothetical protein